MLERATTCVEPAAHHLLRRFEVPTRSNRVLLQSFWRHGGDDLAGPAWWPEYLRNVRRSSQAGLQAERDALRNAGNWGISSLDGSGQHLGINLQRNLRQPSRFALEMQTRFDGSRQDRLYSASCLRSQEGVPLVNVVDQQEFGTPNEKVRNPDQSIFTSPTKPPQNQTFQSPEPNPVHTDPDELLLLIQERPDAFDEAWSLFISRQTQETYARQILQYLSKSKRRIDHERAVRAYKTLSADQKTERTYANAMKVAISRRSQRLALEINCEALSRSLGGESSQIFFAYLVRNDLWNTLAKALEDLRVMQRRVHSDLRDGGHHRAQKSSRRREKPDEVWSRAWAEVDEMLELPEKILSLTRRIESASLSSPLKDPKMKRLASHLLYRVVQSSRIMAVITGNGFLSLLRQYAKIELLAPNHYYQAIRTLHKTLETRNRSQLAALAYRNLRFFFPQAKIPRWIYGSLISIFTDAGQPSHSMRFWLDEFASMHGRPDPKAYQKAMVACARLGDVESVYEIFQRFSDSYGPPQDLGYITPLLYVHARLGDVARTQAQFDRLKSDFDVEPDTFCWNILLASHARAKDSTGAFKVFRDMQQLGVQLDAYSFGTLMGLCANNGDTEAVHKLVDLARKENVPGTTAMVDTLVHTYCLNDEPDSAENLVEAATTMNLEGSQTRMWNTLLRHYAFQADSEAVLRVQERMRKMSVKPDGMTYAALMTALVVIGKTQDAAQILRSLHFNEHLTATLFHYSIVLHGFALEGNRDMVSVIYNEILERFPRPSVSARLAVLHSQAQRDLSAWRARQVRIAPATKMLHLPRALDFLAEILLETSQADLATKDPQPGFQRRSPIEALPSIYMEFLINTLNSSGAFSKAEKLLARCQSLIDTSFLGDSEKTKGSIQLLTAHMVGCIKKKEFARVDSCWDLIVARAISHGQPLLRDPDSIGKGSLESVPPPQPSSAVDIALPKADGLAGFTKHSRSRLEDDGIKVLPSQRYLLAAPITHYIQALGAQNRVALVPELVEKLENAGFSLNSKNYNTYVQVLTQSTHPEHQLQAFKIFEEKLLPNMPSWSLLRRGKWAPQSAPERKEHTGEPTSESEPAQEPVPRKVIESFRPGQLVPTYYTMVYLATALIKFQRRGVKGEAMNLQLLRTHASGTVDAVARLPYLQDRVQGILLRGREVRGDLVKRPRRPPKPDRAGLRGSKSPLDHIPIDHANESRLPDATANAEDAASLGSAQPNVWNANKYTGEILRGPAAVDRTGQTESDLAFHNRSRREERERLMTVEQMRADAKKERLVSDIYFGEPHIESTNFNTHDAKYRRDPVHKAMAISQRHPVLLDDARECVERVWEARHDGERSSSGVTPERLRIGKRRHPKMLRLTLPHSRLPPSSFAGDRPVGPNWLTLFKPPVSPTRRQSKAFILNKRARARRKVFRRQEIAVQNRIQEFTERQSKGQKREQEALLKVNYRPFSEWFRG
jgi:pentatricopeptide repeat-containing protein PET309